MVWSEIINAIDFPASLLSSELAKELGKAVNMEELKKCPFCGGEAKMKVNESTLNTLIACPSCNVTMKNNFKGHKRIKKLLEELAIEAWNRRVEE